MVLLSSYTLDVTVSVLALGSLGLARLGCRLRRGRSRWSLRYARGLRRACRRCPGLGEPDHFALEFDAHPHPTWITRYGLVDRDLMLPVKAAEIDHGIPAVWLSLSFESHTEHR